MTRTTKQALSTLLIFGLFMFVCTDVFAREKPPVPNTGVYVNEINQDWVRLVRDVPKGQRYINDVREFERKIHTLSAYGDEILDTANFACGLYKREAVFLSADFDIDDLGLKVYRMYWFFGCAIP